MNSRSWSKLYFSSSFNMRKSPMQFACFAANVCFPRCDIWSPATKHCLQQAHLAKTWLLPEIFDKFNYEYIYLMCQISDIGDLYRRSSLALAIRIDQNHLRKSPSHVIAAHLGFRQLPRWACKIGPYVTGSDNSSMTKANGAVSSQKRVPGPKNSP